MQCLCKNLNPFRLQFTFTLIPLNKITFPSALTSFYLHVARSVNTFVRRCIWAKDISKPHAPNGHFILKAPELPVTLCIFSPLFIWAQSNQKANMFIHCSAQARTWATVALMHQPKNRLFKILLLKELNKSRWLIVYFCQFPLECEPY